MKAHTLLALALLATALLAPKSAHAQLSFTFVGPPTLTGAPGETLSFFATLNNTSGANIVLQGFNPSLMVSGLTITDRFFDNVPDPLPTGTGPAGGYHIFDVFIDTSADLGTYTGVAQIDYDTTTVPGLSVTQSYAVRVAAVPEPQTGVLLAASLLPLVGMIRRKGYCPLSKH